MVIDTKYSSSIIDFDDPGKETQSELTSQSNVTIRELTVTSAMVIDTKYPSSIIDFDDPGKEN
jgi:hypothetical protein